MNFVTAADGVKLAYDVTGAGAPLLCLPGLTRNMDDFEPVVEEYASRAQVIRMDFRGRGASDHADPATYQVPQEAADVLALLDHLKLPKVTILGTSRGGLVSMVLAASAKDRLSGVILNDVGPEIMTEGLAAIMTYIGRPPDPAHAGRGRGRHARRLCREFPQRAARNMGRLRPAPLHARTRRACTCATTRACARPWRPPSPPMPWPPISGRFSTLSRACRWA
jgi:pimeloyl-ACP methyl ester carboxylesterase